LEKPLSGLPIVRGLVDDVRMAYRI
jgi:hypothetical protein